MPAQKWRGGTWCCGRVRRGFRRSQETARTRLSRLLIVEMETPATTTKETPCFYPVTLTKDNNGTILVRFPDVPDAVTFGDTIAKAKARAIATKHAAPGRFVSRKAAKKR